MSKLTDSLQLENDILALALLGALRWIQLERASSSIHTDFVPRPVSFADRSVTPIFLEPFSGL